jgi:hypothetical protein
MGAFLKILMDVYIVSFARQFGASSRHLFLLPSTFVFFFLNFPLLAACRILASAEPYLNLLSDKILSHENYEIRYLSRPTFIQLHPQESGLPTPTLKERVCSQRLFLHLWLY